MTKIYVAIACALFTMTAWISSSSEAFQEQGQRTGRSGVSFARSNNQDPFANQTSNYRDLARLVSGSRDNLHVAGPFAEAVQAFKDAEDSEAKEKAAETIESELKKQYDAFLVANEKQIDELQTRLDNLRDQLERRRDAKGKMVELEMERVINESEGLIWPSRSGRRVRSFFPGSQDNLSGITRWRSSGNARGNSVGPELPDVPKPARLPGTSR